MQEKLTQDWNRDLGIAGSAPQKQSPSNERICQINRPRTVSAAHSSSFLPTEFVVGALNQSVSGSSINLTSPNPPLHFDEDYNASCTPLLHTRCGFPDVEECIQQYRPNFAASHDVMRTEEAYQASIEGKAEAVDFEDRLKEQFITPRASILGVCLCGCGGDAVHCLRPNTLPSPNTFWENWWGPHFASMLKTRLNSVASDLEPSRRIWWRETFGGCAPDREPLISERWAWKGDDWGKVLRTSPPPYLNDKDISRIMSRPRPLFLRRRPRPHSTTSLDTPDSSLHDAANSPLQAYTYAYTKASKSLPIYETGKNPDRQLANYWANLSSHHYFLQIMTPHRGTKRLETLTNHNLHEIPLSKSSNNSRKHHLNSIKDLPMEAESKEVRRQPVTRGLSGKFRRPINFDQGRNIAGENPILCTPSCLSEKQMQTSAVSLSMY